MRQGKKSSGNIMFKFSNMDHTYIQPDKKSSNGSQWAVDGSGIMPHHSPKLSSLSSKMSNMSFRSIKMARNPSYYKNV